MKCSPEDIIKSEKIWRAAMEMEKGCSCCCVSRYRRRQEPAGLTDSQE